MHVTYQDEATLCKVVVAGFARPQATNPPSLTPPLSDGGCLTVFVGQH